MLKTIDVDDLQVGMFLHELAGSWLKNPFWRTSRLLADPHEIARVKECGIRKAVIDTSRGLDLASPATLPMPTFPEDQPQSVAAPAVNPLPVGELEKSVAVSLDVELGRATQICAHSKKAVMRMFNEARMGNALDGDIASVVVDEIAGSIARNSSAFISLARLKTLDDYTYMHSVSVCALMIALARQLGLDEHRIKEAGKAGLMHDIGKMAVPLTVLNKPGKLTDDEFASVRGHPEAGHRMLQQLGGINEATLEVCLHHHEKMDGTGYPHGLAGDEISLYSRMGAVCDVYDAITSNRPYKDGWCPAESLKKMASWMGNHFDPAIFQAFVKAVGIYPVGSLVRLKSNRLAVVVDQNEKSLLAPVVRVFFSCTAIVYIQPELIDLSMTTEGESILSLESAEKWGLTNINRFWP